MERSRPPSLRTVRLVLVSAQYAYRGLFAWLTPFAYLTEKIVTPLGALTFFTLLGVFATGTRSAAFYVFGNAVLASTANGIFAVARGIDDERAEGTLVYLIASPAPRSAFYAGRALLHILDGAATVVMTLGWGIILFGVGVRWQAFPLLLGAFVIATAGAAGLGLFLGSLSLVTLGSVFLANLALIVVGLVSGANVPLERLPEVFQLVGRMLPLSRSVEAVRLLAADGSTTEALRLLAEDLLLGVAYGIAGFVVFRWIELQARRRGTLGLL